MYSFNPEGRLQTFAAALWRLRQWSGRRLYSRTSVIPQDVLIVLARAPGGRVSYPDLQAIVGRSHRALQYVLRDLVDLGLITMSRSSEDRRCVLIGLSDKGRQTMVEYMKIVNIELSTAAPGEGDEATRIHESGRQDVDTRVIAASPDAVLLPHLPAAVDVPVEPRPDRRARRVS